MYPQESGQIRGFNKKTTRGMDTWTERSNSKCSPLCLSHGSVFHLQLTLLNHGAENNLAERREQERQSKIRALLGTVTPCGLGVSDTSAGH